LLDIRSEEGNLKRVRAGMLFPMQPTPATGQPFAPSADGPVGETSLAVAPEPPPLREAA
jgi:hypothetical protein